MKVTEMKTSMAPVQEAVPSLVVVTVSFISVTPHVKIVVPVMKRRIVMMAIS